MTNHGIVDVVDNAMDNTDGYKLDHRRQAPNEWSCAYENWTPRKSRIEGIDYVVQFGLQPAMKEHLIDNFNKNFFQQPRALVCADYLETVKDYLGETASRAIGIKHIEALHDLGYLPVTIRAVPEGTRTKIRMPQWTIKTSKKHRKAGTFAWVPGYLETLLSCQCWGPSTSATIAHAYREIFEYWADQTGADKSFVPFQGHDFSFRGMYGVEAAKMSGGAHLTSFVGTDTIPAIKWLKKYYHADSKDGIIGCSVAATEHAVMCIGTGFYVKTKNLTWEKYGEAELEVFKRLITEVYPTGIVSVVSDTWNLWTVLNEYLPALKDVIMARDGKLVIRPDSGDPVKILTGYFDDEVAFDVGQRIFLRDADGNITNKEISHTEYLGVVQKLWTIFGGTITSKGHRQLDSHIGCIYGDSITLVRAEEICTRLAQNNFSSTNWVAGIGSFTYQYQTRDTFGFALKATYGECEVPATECPEPDGKECTGRCTHVETLCIEIQKDPITDDGTKKSLKGLIQCYKNETTGELEARDGVTWDEEDDSFYETVFEDGELVKDYTLKEIRERLWPSNT
jgi:nicotinamide phosphoribosyltransferase